MYVKGNKDKSESVIIKIKKWLKIQEETYYKSYNPRYHVLGLRFRFFIICLIVTFGLIFIIIAHKVLYPLSGGYITSDVKLKINMYETNINKVDYVSNKSETVETVETVEIKTKIRNLKKIQPIRGVQMNKFEEKNISKLVNEMRNINESFPIGSVEWFEWKVGVNSRGIDRIKKQKKEYMKRWYEVNENITGPLDGQKCSKVERIKKVPMALIVSNRRSGTHLSLDMIHNLIEGDKVIVKANHIAAIEGELSCACRNWIYANTKLVHTGRNLLDVVVSMFHYRSLLDKKYRESTTWMSYLNSDWLLKVIKRWVHTEHSWYIDAKAHFQSFEKTVSLDPESLEDVASYLGMSLTKNMTKLKDRHSWEIISHPVLSNRGNGKGKGKGKGKFGYKKVMSKKIQDKILDIALKNSIWRYDQLLSCPVKKYNHNEICVSSNGKRTILRNEKRCWSFGSFNILKPLTHYGRQSGFCIPKSCPRDLIEGSTFSFLDGVNYFAKHKKLSEFKQNTIVGPPFSMSQLQNVKPA